jgi:hypothetical protein
MMVEAKGTVDHFQSWAATKEAHPELAYEWENYRFCSFAINCLKNKYDDDVVDPFEVQDDWFRVTLPDMQLQITDRVPADRQDLVERTVNRLQLSHGEDLVEFRRSWYDQYKQDPNDSVLNIIQTRAPLVARAIRDKLTAGEPLP